MGDNSCTSFLFIMHYQQVNDEYIEQWSVIETKGDRIIVAYKPKNVVKGYICVSEIIDTHFLGHLELYVN